MKRIFFIAAVLLISFAVYSQTKDKKAKEYYDDGCEKVIKKNFAEAIADFSEAIKRDSDFIQAYENRGVAKFYLNDNLGAIADYTKALEINLMIITLMAEEGGRGTMFMTTKEQLPTLPVL